MRDIIRTTAALAILVLAAGAVPLAAQGYGSTVTVGDGEVFISEPTATTRPGAVYVYGGADGGWSEIQRLEASDASDNDYFGLSVAVDGDVLFAGATVKDSSHGAAYVFERGADGSWSESQRLQPDDLSPDDAFGRVIAVDGDLAAVATWGQNDEAGAVYVYRRDASGNWSRSGKLAVEDIGSESRFGSSVAIDGDRILVGAAGRNSGTGAAFLFEPGDQDDWEQVATLTPQGLDRGYQYGTAALLDGDEALVSAPGQNGARGAVHVFRWDEDEEAWSQAGQLMPFDGPPRAQLGTFIARVDGEVWVGAPGAGDFEGRIYRFARDDDAWTTVDKLAADDLEQGDGFGAAGSVSGDVAAVGLAGDDFGAGTAVIFHRGADGTWAGSPRLAGEVDNYAAITGGSVACSDGQASHFGCENIEILSFLPISEIGGERGVETNDIWGWTDPETGREYALVGRVNATSFVDITDPENPVYLGQLPLTDGARPNSWRDIKVYEDHAFVVADGAGEHGVQVFDLTQLRDVEDAPVTFEETAHYDRVASVHNIVMNTETGFAYAVGSGGGGETCGGGLHMIDVREPTNPTFAGCYAAEGTGRAGTGYTHDAQCVVYQGPDAEYQGQELCFGANETALNIADVTDKENPVSVSTAQYPNVGYTHQGWLSEDHRYFYLDDELDELQGLVDRTRLLVWDVSDLDEPVLVNEYYGPTGSSDHNLYIVGDRMYWSTYVSGFRVLDISDPENPTELGHIDTVPYGENEPGFGGSWSNYPYFESGNIVVTSGAEGLFVVRPAPDLLSEGYHTVDRPD